MLSAATLEFQVHYNETFELLLAKTRTRGYVSSFNLGQLFELKSDILKSKISHSRRSTSWANYIPLVQAYDYLKVNFSNVVSTLLVHALLLQLLWQWTKWLCRDSHSTYVNWQQKRFGRHRHPEVKLLGLLLDAVVEHLARFFYASSPKGAY